MGGSVLGTLTVEFHKELLPATALFTNIRQRREELTTTNTIAYCSVIFIIAVKHT